MKKILSLLLAAIMTVSSFGLVSAAPEPAIKGVGLVVLPADADTEYMYVTDYALYMDSQKLDAVFSIEGDVTGIFMSDDGSLITSSDAVAGEIIVKALYEGRTYTKTVTTEKGYYIDFESDTVGAIPSGWANRASYVVQENGNKYIDGVSTYGQLPFSDNLASESVTVEFDAIFKNVNNSVKGSTVGFNRGYTDTQFSTGGVYYSTAVDTSQVKNSTTMTIRKNKDENGNSISRVAWKDVPFDEWIPFKMVLNTNMGTYDLYVEDEMLADDWKFSSTLNSYTFTHLIAYGYLDNIKVYTGTPGAYSASAPTQRAVLPESGKTSSVKLGMNLTVGTETYENLKTTWELKTPYTGVSVNGNVLTVTDEAEAGDVVLVPTDDRFDCEKTVTLTEPTIYLDTTDSAVTITADPSADYVIRLYHPKSQSGDMAESFLDAYTEGDPDAVVTSDAITMGADGRYTYSTQSLDAGFYNVYVEPVPNDAGEVAAIKLYNKMSSLLSDSAAMQTSGFAQLLIKENVPEAAEAHSVYNSLADKDYVVTLTDGYIGDFSAATALAAILEQSTDSAGLRAFATSALEGAQYDASALELLSKNRSYTGVTEAVAADNCTNITDLLSSIKKHSILKGIKNAASTDEVKDFVTSLGISKFDNARESQKDYMAGLLINNAYASADDIADVIAAADLSMVEIGYHIDGNASAALPAKAGTMSALEYKLIDTELDTAVDAEFSISGDDVTGLYMTKDGTLITSPKATDGTIRVNAVYQGKTYSKDVSLRLGMYSDFESDTPGQKPSGWVDREVAVATDSFGNNYLNSLDVYARYNFAQDLASRNVTVEYDVKYTVVDNKINTSNVVAFTHGWTNRAESKGRYYLGMSAALSSDKANVEFSRAYNQNGTSSSTYLASAPIDTWVSIKHVFDFEDKTYDIYINSVKVADGWKMDTDITEATLVGIIPYGYTDNFHVYSGDTGAFSASAPAQSAALPRTGKVTQTSLGLDLTIGDTTYTDAITSWTLKVPCEGVMVEGNVLTVTDSASAGTVQLMAKDGNIDVTKEVTLFEPTILLDIEGTDLNVSAKSNENYNIYIYKNKGGAELIDKFITPTFYGDMTAVTEDVLNVNAGASGNITRSLSHLDAGIYNIYVRESASDAEIAHVQYISHLSDLFADFTQVISPKFVTFLTNQGIKYTSASKAQDIYKALDNKAPVYSLMGDEISMFTISAPLCKILQISANDNAVSAYLADGLESRGYDSSALELLSKNAVYTDVTNAVVSEGLSDVDTVLDNLKTISVLKGIKNVANKRDAKVFLAHIASAVYDGASNDEKNIIADAIAKNTYLSINDVRNAVAAVDLTGGTGGSTGPSAVSPSGGSSSGVGAPAPVVKPAQPQGTYTDVSADFWAKESIELLSEKGIIAGYNGSFRPDDTLSRGEMAKIICVAANLGEGKADFADVSANDWYYPYVGAAFESGLINGYDGIFNPDASITRQDVAVILYRLFGSKLAKSDGAGFADSSDIADYALGAVSALASNSIINGYQDGTFKPQNNITRAEIAHLMANCISLWEVNSND